MAKKKKEDTQPQTPVEEEDEEYIEKKKKKSKKKKEEIDVKIETMREHPEKISPIIGYFPSGFDPLKDRAVHGQDEESDSQQHRVKVYRHVKRNNRLQMVVSPNGSQVDFVGTSYLGEATAPQVCTYALGVLDKETQTLKIIPVAANKVVL